MRICIHASTIEIRKDIVWYEWYYQISNFGRVKSLLRKVKKKWICIIPEKIMKLQYDKDWYQQIWLTDTVHWKKLKTYRIHRLVALHFIPNPKEKPVPNHKDWNKTNNHIDNLERATNSENELHSYRILWKTPNRNQLGKKWKDSKSSKRIIQYYPDWRLKSIWDSIADIERGLWYDHRSISSCCLWKQKTAYGFQRQYFSL